jgi:class 3 adenylate cyclase
MVFFNDPLPIPDHAQQAVKMAVAMRQRMDGLIASWRKLGHALGFGVGIAVGYATLGQIGFEGRFDYGAIGSVTNLASRLCGEARAGQILVTPRAYAATESLVKAECIGELTLKGLLKPVIVYNILEFQAAEPE